MGLCRLVPAPLLRVSWFGVRSRTVGWSSLTCQLGPIFSLHTCLLTSIFDPWTAADGSIELLPSLTERSSCQSKLLQSNLMIELYLNPWELLSLREKSNTRVVCKNSRLHLWNYQAAHFICSFQTLWSVDKGNSVQRKMFQCLYWFV